MFDVLIQLLVVPRCFRYVKVAASKNAEVRRGEIERRCDIVEVSICDKLSSQCQLLSQKASPLSSSFLSLDPYLHCECVLVAVLVCASPVGGCCTA
jgi:hypothetical protein